MYGDSPEAFKNFISDVHLNISLEKSIINTSDLQYFVTIPEGFNESVWISGKILGTVSELRGRDIELFYRNYTRLSCDFDFSGLPEFGNTFMYFGINSFRTNARDFENIYMPGKGRLVIPDALYNLKDISFNGSFTGFLN